MAGINLTGRGKWLAIAAVAIVIVAGVVAGWAARTTDDSIDLDRIVADIESGNFDRALADLDRAEALFTDAELNDRIAWTYGERGFIHLAQGEYDLSIAALDRAIELDPTQPTFYNNRALGFERLDRIEDAESDFTNAILFDSTNYERYVERGFFYLNGGEDENALADADAAVTLAPDQPIALTLRADTNSRFGYFAEALNDLNRIIELTPNEWGPYVSRAVVQNSLGAVPAAISDLDAALALDPPDEGVELIEATRTAILDGVG